MRIILSAVFLATTCMFGFAQEKPIILAPLSTTSVLTTSTLPAAEAGAVPLAPVPADPFLVHAHTDVPCEIIIDPLWQEADELRSKLEGDPFASAFGALVKDLKENNTEFQLWRVEAEHHRNSLCLPHTKNVYAHESRLKTFISKGCSQPTSNRNLYEWCIAEHAWLTSEQQNLNAREMNEINPSFDHINNWGQKLLTKGRLAVERAKEILDPRNLENSFRLYAFAVLKDVRTGGLTSCEALAQMSDALGPKTVWQYGRHLAVMGSVLATENNPILIVTPNVRSVQFTASGFRRRFVGPPGSEKDNQVRHAVAYLMMGAEFGVPGATLGTTWEDRFKKWWDELVPEEHDYLLGIAAGEIGRDLKYRANAYDLGNTIRARLCGH